MRNEDLLQRLLTLEERVAALETHHSKPGPRRNPDPEENAVRVINYRARGASPQGVCDAERYRATAAL